MKEIVISTHAQERWRERKNLTYKITINKLAKQAYTKGARTDEYRGAFRKYLKEIEKKEYYCNNQFTIVYKNYILIFAHTKDCILLVTCFEIPNRFGEKNFAIMGAGIREN